jgi:hypothetical protein
MEVRRSVILGQVKAAMGGPGRISSIVIDVESPAREPVRNVRERSKMAGTVMSAIVRDMMKPPQGHVTKL